MDLKNISKNLFTFISCAIVFVLISIPFIMNFSIGNYTEIRPAAALPPAFGMLFGFYGALGCAVANLFCDWFISGYSFGVCFWGFLAQFIFGYLPYYLWKAFENGEVRFDKSIKFLKYIGIITFNSLVMTFMIAVILHHFAGVDFVSLTMFTILFNDIIMGILLGIPIVLGVSVFRAIKEQKHRTINERFTWDFLILGMVSSDLVGIVIWLENLDLKSIDELWKHIYFFCGIDLLVFIVLIYVILRFLEKRVTFPLEKIIDIAKEFIQSDKGSDACHDIAGKCQDLSCEKTEIGYLAQTIKDLVINIDNSIDELARISAEKDRIKRELSIATTIQTNMLPTIFPPFPNRTDIDLFASMTAAKEVGGDFYDFYFVDENTLAILIADVSGKGIPAAMFMMTAKTLIKNMSETGMSVDQVLCKVNEKLCSVNEAGMFVTVWMGMINLSNGKLSFVNAGHNPPLIKHGNGDFEFLNTKSGFVLAGMEGTKYRKTEIQLMPGDSIYLYTDGITEANNKDNSLYGKENLLHTINQVKNKSSVEICHSVMESVEKFTGDAEQFDDITMLSFCLKEIDGYNNLTLVPTLENIPKMTNFVENWMLKTKVDQKNIRKVNIVIDEICSNIAYYSKANWVKIHYERDLSNIYLEFIDDGVPYNPLETEDVDTDLTLEDRKEGGLGIFMVKKIMDDVSYEYSDGKNIFRVSKKL